MELPAPTKQNLFADSDLLIRELQEAATTFNTIKIVVERAETQGFSQEVLLSMKHHIEIKDNKIVPEFPILLAMYLTNNTQLNDQMADLDILLILSRIKSYSSQLHESNNLFMEKYNLQHLQGTENHLASCYAWYHTIILLRKEIMKLGKEIFQLYGQSPRPEEELEQLNKRLIIMTNNLQQAELQWSQWTSRCAELKIK